MRFPIWWSDKKLKTLKLYRQKLLHAINVKELLFKVGPNTILLPKQRNIWPNKSFREWPKIPKYRFLWENSEMGGIWHYWCSTTNKNDQLFQHKWERNRKNKRKIWKQNKKCLHKCTYCLLLAGNLKCSCYLLLARKKCNLRWIQNNSWYQWGTVVLVLRGGNCWFWLFIVTQENFILVKCLKKVEA